MNTNIYKSLEIDFHSVNSGEKSGDAISFRYGDFNDPQQQYVVIIDGGTLETGKDLVKHVQEVYNTDFIDLVVCTHPDGDHSSGLREVLKELTVDELWMHRPWEHSSEIRELFKDGRITENSLSERLQNAYKFAYELEKIAIEKNITILEPFVGLNFRTDIQVLGPSEEYYQSLIPDFTKSPEAKESLISKAIGAVKEAVNWVKETLSMDTETLDESGITSPENNSSCVLLFTFNDKTYLFTGDAGIPSLKNVIDQANKFNIDLKTLDWLQVPHHGSRRNSSPSVLNEIKAPIAYISASKDSEKHPSKKVVNALKRRGSRVYTTDGGILLHPKNASQRAGYGPATELPFNDLVEE